MKTIQEVMSKYVDNVDDFRLYEAVKFIGMETVPAGFNSVYGKSASFEVPYFESKPSISDITSLESAALNRLNALLKDITSAKGKFDIKPVTQFTMEFREFKKPKAVAPGDIGDGKIVDGYVLDVPNSGYVEYAMMIPYDMYPGEFTTKPKDYYKDKGFIEWCTEETYEWVKSKLIPMFKKAKIDITTDISTLGDKKGYSDLSTIGSVRKRQEDKPELHSLFKYQTYKGTMNELDFSCFYWVSNMMWHYFNGRMPKNNKYDKGIIVNIHPKFSCPPYYFMYNA